MPDEILELHPGCAGKAEVLSKAIRALINQEQFGDMTVSEIIGTLELVKLALAQAL